MEEGGHYYTVYTVSLAVGFANHVARRHAFFAQMPDEVDQLDAAHLEMTFASRYGVGRVGMIEHSAGVPAEPPVYMRENEWRVMVEHALHSLTGRNAREEQRRTRELLRGTRVNDYLRFGLLLHRFGDTYAHTRISNPEFLYYADPRFPIDPGGHGHAMDEHHPDHPWEREDLMNSYVSGLYELMAELARMPANAPYLRRPPEVRSLAEVRNIFATAIQEAHRYFELRDESCTWTRPAPPGRLCTYDENTGPQRYFINSIRDQVRWRINVIMATYEPENSELLNWTQFRSRYGRSSGPVENYSWNDVESAIYQIRRDLNL
ncbi:MAG: hypothetical protein U0X91_04285 [Spirosomataceae bacterium]